MSNIDKQALREAAEKAGKDKWQAKKINGDFYVIRSGSYIKQCGITSYQPIAEIDHKPVRDFVAMVNPATTLALLDENLQLQREKDAIEAVALALRDDLRQGFKEAFRVLWPNGVLIFKWNETQIPVSQILALTDVKPIIGQRTGKNDKTHWIIFVKD